MVDVINFGVGGETRCSEMYVCFLEYITKEE